MKKTILTTLLILIATFACQKKSENNEISDELKSLDYIKDLRFLLTANDINNLLPSDKKNISDNEDGLLYEFSKDGIKHEVTALFYGDKFFTTLITTLIFSDDKQQDAVFMYLNKILENKYGKPADYNKSKLEETITWFEEINDDPFNHRISLSRFQQTIAVSYLTIPRHEEDFKADEENGEWVQRGENGEWIFVPN